MYVLKEIVKKAVRCFYQICKKYPHLMSIARRVCNLLPLSLKIRIKSYLGYQHNDLSSMPEKFCAEIKKEDVILSRIHMESGNYLLLCGDYELSCGFCLGLLSINQST